MAKRRREVESSQVRSPDAFRGSSENENPPSDDRGTDSLLREWLDCIVQRFAERFTKDPEAALPSIPDFMRIVQLRREIGGDDPVRTIEVRWVESSEEDISE